jgi:phage tail sheath protein FI
MAYKTPGVYIVEKNAFPNSVVEVETAVPAFIGHTEKADNKGLPLADTPWRITSMAQFIDYFGNAPPAKFTIAARAADDTDRPDFSVPGAAGADPTAYRLKAANSYSYLLYYSMQLFFQNGGGACYIVSIGDYKAAPAKDKMIKAIDALKKEQEPTMVVIPEAVELFGSDDNPASECIAVQQYALKHCGAEMKNRFAILDIYNGFRGRNEGDWVAKFRDALGINNLNFAAAYYPWLDSAIVSAQDVTFESIDAAMLKTLLSADMDLAGTGPTEAGIAKVNYDAKKAAVDHLGVDWTIDDKLKTDADLKKAKEDVHLLLGKFSPLYGIVTAAVAKRLNRLPPSAAMAGLYTAVDKARGVWKAPANVSLNAVIAPTVAINQEEQEDLNVTTGGKSINAIRSFIGAGTLVWGARTLDGNSLDWRYINVRRTMIMLEESIRLATIAYVFEPNVANTWVTIKGMIRNFLTGIWKRGGLAGASPDDAFEIYVGLGETMTADDILEGLLNVTVKVAMVRPAEFIEITFQQQMQKS